MDSEDVSWSDLMASLGITKLPHELEPGDVIGKQLQSICHWKSFYYHYSKLKGFGVRKDKLRKDNNNVVWQRIWVCSREGYREEKWLNMVERKKTPKPLTRIGCNAHLTVTLDRKTSTWTATSFIASHNHDVVSPSELQFLRSNREVPDSMLAQAKSMRKVGIRTMSIVDYMAMQCGGRDHLPFLKKDLYNRLTADRNAIGTETDSEGALGYLSCIAMRDNNLYCRFKVDEEDRLNTIFWADGTSRKDYQIFGEVIAFDTTYRTNAYNKPLMILVGVNHHFRTNVFGVALLVDETTSTFIWVLEQFLDCMERKHPKVIVTDGDNAMRSVISQVFPSSLHRLCAWHLDTNAASNVPDGEFKIKFTKLMYKFYTEDEFEAEWQKVIDEHNLVDNTWAINTYAKKKSWAETFLRGNFVAGMRTTQRCESMNSYMRRFMQSKHLLRDFISQIDVAVQNIRHTEMQDDFTSKHSEPLIPSSDPLSVYYEQFESAFTRNIYNKICKEIEEQNCYSITTSDYTSHYTVFHLSRFRFGEIRHRVRYLPRDNIILCGCLLMETDGIPCRHIFAVMKHLNIDRIPRTLMHPRWRKDAKNSVQINYSPNLKTPDALQVTRLGMLSSDFNTLGLFASQYEDTFLEAREHIATMTQKFKSVIDLRQGETANSQQNYNEARASSNNIVRDPIRAKTKGRERETNKSRQVNSTQSKEPHRKRCRICNELGHNKATCKKKNSQTTHVQLESSSHDVDFNNTTYSQVSASTFGCTDDTTFRHNVEHFPTFNYDQEHYRPYFSVGTSSNLHNFGCSPSSNTNFLPHAH